MDKETKTKKVAKVAKVVAPKPAPKIVVPKIDPKPIEKVKSKRYIEAIGRRKTSTARVRVTPDGGNIFTVNNRELKKYFMTAELYKIVNDPVSKIKSDEKLSITVMVSGGGIHSQAEAVRHGISRVLVMMDEESRGKLKKLGFLKRDPRSKERRKFGLKKARKAPQWSKR